MRLPAPASDIEVSFAVFPRSLLPRALALLFALLFPAFSLAQTAPPKPALITQPIEESKLTVLRGNTYPLARAKYDRGAAPASLPMQRMLLVLKRGPDWKPRSSAARPAARQILAELPRLAHSRAIRPAIRPRRRGHSDHHLVAAAPGLSGRKSFERPHRNRILRHRRASTKRISHRDSQVLRSTAQTTGPMPATPRFRRRLCLP